MYFTLYSLFVLFSLLRFGCHAGVKSNNAQRSARNQDELLGLLHARNGQKSCGEKRQWNGFPQISPQGQRQRHVPHRTGQGENVIEYIIDCTFIGIADGLCLVFHCTRAAWDERDAEDVNEMELIGVA